MGAILCSEIETNARTLLRDIDPDGDYEHSPEAMFAWIKEAHSAAVLLKHEINTVNQAVQLQPGTRQELPAGGILILRVTNNMGADGQTPGTAITIVDRDPLDQSTPGWHFDSPSQTVQHYIFEVHDPTHFDVYPPQPASAGYLRVAYVANPDIPDDVDQPITLDDIYAPVLTDYVVYRALSGDSANSANKQRADEFYTKFAESLGVKRKVELALAPVAGGNQ